MFYRIKSATARADPTVGIVWDDDSRSVVSFSDLVARGGVCLPMRDPTFFVEQMRVTDDGHALTWPDEVDFSADALWYRSHPQDAEKETTAA